MPGFPGPLKRNSEMISWPAVAVALMPPGTFAPELWTPGWVLILSLEAIPLSLIFTVAITGGRIMGSTVCACFADVVRARRRFGFLVAFNSVTELHTIAITNSETRIFLRISSLL